MFIILKVDRVGIRVDYFEYVTVVETKKLEHKGGKGDKAYKFVALSGGPTPSKKPRKSSL